jgi:ubiquinone/menaquinone biosynthesis C-methylase UbiE
MICPGPEEVETPEAAKCLKSDISDRYLFLLITITLHRSGIIGKNINLRISAGGWRMPRRYQYGLSSKSSAMFDIPERERKARTMVAVIEDFLDGRLKELSLLDVGGSTGIIDNYLSNFFGKVTGIDIDEAAIRHATETYRKENLEFLAADALNLPFADESFDVVICSQVYEHVPDPDKMFEEIFRVLRRGGVCYFAANNRLALNEPHYNLPLLSLIPRPLANIYMRLAGRGSHYYEQHLSYWGLRSLTRRFRCIDYTIKTVLEPKRFFTDYMIRPKSLTALAARIVLRYIYWASPGYIWVLQKP